MSVLVKRWRSNNRGNERRSRYSVQPMHLLPPLLSPPTDAVCPLRARECETILYEELSYIGEGRRADRFRRNFTADGISWVQVPRVYWQYSGPRVLTLEYMPGIKITNVDELKAAVSIRMAQWRDGVLTCCSESRWYL